MSEESSAYHLTTVSLPASLVADAEAEVSRLNADRADTERPAGLADLVAAALIHAIGGRCCGESEPLDADDAARLEAWRR